MPKRVSKSLSTLVSQDPFEAAVLGAIVEISTADATRAAYRRDFDVWLEFCRERDVDRLAPTRFQVAAWVEWLKGAGGTRKPDAPKTRSRRISSLSSIYRQLRRDEVVEGNPFSIEEGPKRERTAVQTPTPLPAPELVRGVLAACDDGTPAGVRDNAMIRVLWSTGMRRVSLLSMTWERLQRDPAGYVATVVKKGGETQRVLITGSALAAFERWLAILRDGGLTSREIWREFDGAPMTSREVNRMLDNRAPGEQRFSPHMLRVAFLTYNKAGIEEKQDAAGHADPATTRGYDRESWRGRKAFEKMPEVEDL